MNDFASNTGLSSASVACRRYLWTDAFAVCNYLGLWKVTKDEKYRQLALSLVDQVHNVLGRHRSDDKRKGWISGLSEEQGKLHPTSGGLRIGKKMMERQVNEPYDDDLEWDRDGQYYHYLTKWMHAMNTVTLATSDNKYNKWAAELAQGTHEKFTYDSGGGRKRMYWKMSIDLSYPLVQSMGHHDPLDGYITYLQIQRTLRKQGTEGPDLSQQISDMSSICKGKDWVTTDPLGLGGLLCDCYRVMVMLDDNDIEGGEELLEKLLGACNTGMKSYTEGRYGNQLQRPAQYRLAFRELGLAIGLQAIDQMQNLLNENTGLITCNPRTKTLLDSLRQYEPLVETINSFWSNQNNQRASSWTGHLDINMVMWATSLMPDGFFGQTS
ncbi:predicted protein [Nematostella vectensis]|uniref:Uncharacterized protein n=2 Tax=Nematostella vectensis TaxID=45351 RepID=A7RIS2_NEMVE|nr:predicted protein [Nematostella vectensis]|eukprot:XP_001640512.1 predicted protein [Nematostella vectensis]